MTQTKLYLRLIHPGSVHSLLPIGFLKDVGWVEGEVATAVIQRDVAQFVCVLLADPLQAGSSDPCRWCLHVEKMTAVPEAVRHSGTRPVEHHQERDGKGAGAKEMHPDTAGDGKVIRRNAAVDTCLTCAPTNCEKLSCDDGECCCDALYWFCPCNLVKWKDCWTETQHAKQQQVRLAPLAVPLSGPIMSVQSCVHSTSESARIM